MKGISLTLMRARRIEVTMESSQLPHSWLR